MENAREVMRKRFLKERKEELEKELKKDESYLITVSTKFVGQFSHFEEKNGMPVAVFIQGPGTTDKGATPYRRIMVDNLESYHHIK